MVDIKAQILELRRAGIGFSRVAEQLGLADADRARELYLEALDDTDPRFDLALEVERIDRLHAVAWKKAVGGDWNAMDRAIRLGERRERLCRSPRENMHEMRAAYDDTIEHAPLREGLDDAAIASGRAIADRIDAALCGADETETTKALYLLPHLMNILRELGATPRARLESANGMLTGKEPATNGTARRRQKAAERRAAASR